MDKIINVAVVAHVDAGKSTLVDALLEQNGVFRANEVVKDCVLENGNHLTNQKISALLKQLVESNKVVKVTDKKKSYFSVSE